MKLEDQVVSLDLAKKLKELGVKQESYFYWIGESIWNPTDQSDYETRNTPPKSEWVPAFTVSELLGLLGKNFGVLEQFHDDKGWGAYIPNDCAVNGMGKTPCDALAELLIKVTYGREDTE